MCDSKKVIDLRGSVVLILNFFNCAINRILLERKVFAKDTFKPIKKFGTKTYISRDKNIANALNDFLNAVKHLLQESSVQVVSMVIKDSADHKVLEKWTFRLDSRNACVSSVELEPEEEAKIQQDLRRVFNEISSVSQCLPQQLMPRTFDFEVETSTEEDMSKEFEVAPKQVVRKPQTIKFGSVDAIFNTIAPTVSYSKC